MSDVVLVYPKSSYIETAMNHFYLPLAFLNSVVYIEKDFSVKIIDQRTDPNWREHLLIELRTNPLCVGITALTGEQIAYALKVTKLVKTKSDVPVIWGGVHASILPEQTLRNSYIDFVIEGEGEIAFSEFVKALANKKPLKDVRGLWYKEGGIINNNPPLDHVDLNALPDLPYHLVEIENYILRFDSRRMFILESSRGCPGSCTFCFVQQICSQRKWRALTPSNTVEKIKRIKREFGVEGVEFQDLDFFVDPERIKKFSELLIKENINIFWNAGARIIDILKLDSEAINLLERSGLRRLALGVESGSERILNILKKDITIEQVLKVSEILSGTNIPPLFSFITGFPTETEAELKMTTDLINKLLKDNPRAKTSILHCFRPLPGTELFVLCVRNGLRVPANLEEWSMYDMEKIDYPWLSLQMQKEISALNFLSLFIDRKFEEIDSILVQLFAKCFKPLAKYRFEHYDFRFLIEPYLKRIFVKLRR